MNTNSIALAGALTTIAIAGTALGGLNGLTCELIGYDLIDGTYTIRLYAKLDAGDRLNAVYGNSENGFSITMHDGASLYQNNTFGGPTSKSINSAFFSNVPSLEWDSYVTIGALYADGTPFDNNALQDIGIDWASFEAGGDVASDNGTWFVTPDDAQGEAQGGRVLIAQMTIYPGSGGHDMNFTAGFQGMDANGTTWNAEGSYVHYWCPAPGALALLGLAGLARTRRRRS